MSLNLNENLPKKRGRPRKNLEETNIEPKIHKAAGLLTKGRPRKYDYNNIELLKEIKTNANKSYYEKRGYYTNKIKYYINRYDISITREDFVEKSIDELKEILIKIENKINEIKKINMENKIISKQQSVIKKTNKKNNKEENILKKIEDKQEILINKIEKIKHEEHKKLHKLVLQQLKIQNKEFKPKQIKMRITD